jgi:hypothetical protein
MAFTSIKPITIAAIAKLSLERSFLKNLTAQHPANCSQELSARVASDDANTPGGYGELHRRLNVEERYNTGPDLSNPKKIRIGTTCNPQQSRAVPGPISRYSAKTQPHYDRATSEEEI